MSFTTKYFPVHNWGPRLATKKETQESYVIAEASSQSSVEDLTNVSASTQDDIEAAAVVRSELASGDDRVQTPEQQTHNGVSVLQFAQAWVILRYQCPLTP